MSNKRKKEKTAHLQNRIRAPTSHLHFDIVRLDVGILGIVLESFNLGSIGSLAMTEHGGILVVVNSLGSLDQSRLVEVRMHMSSFFFLSFVTHQRSGLQYYNIIIIII